MENRLVEFVRTNKQLQKGVTTPNRELDELVERLRNLR